MVEVLVVRCICPGTFALGDALWLKPRADKGQSLLRRLRNIMESPKETSLLASPPL
jgi:hypothetical protein